MPVKVLFVCLGNICRSPTAHGVFRHKVALSGLKQTIDIDSCGTGSWHIGAKPDSRSLAVASGRGYIFDDLRARQLAVDDFADYDYILAMDKQNLTDIKALCPAGFGGHIELFLRFGDGDVLEVPDPYYGGEQGFERVLDLIEQAADGLLLHIQANDL